MGHTDLVAELARKSGIVWVEVEGRPHPVWHVWADDAVCVVSGGGEQPLPHLTDGQGVTLLLRSKSTRALVARAAARADVVEPGSEHWEPVTVALRAGRLNLADPGGAVDRWARSSRVVRLVPTGDVDLGDAIGDTAGPADPRPHA